MILIGEALSCISGLRHVRIDLVKVRSVLLEVALAASIRLLLGEFKVVIVPR
jgi:hypothetical protein